MKTGTKNSEKKKRGSAGPEKCGAHDICRFCHMVNPALRVYLQFDAHSYK
jgi:hypothetical protein